MPPRHGKSELTSRYLPAWYLGTYPQRNVILASYESDFAASWGRKARNLLEEFGSDWFGVQVAADSSAAMRWHLRQHGGGMQSCGAGGPITGKGASLLVIDDPVKGAEDADSPAKRNKVWDWFRSVAYTRLEPTGTAILVMTRWHRDDLAGRLLDEMDKGGESWETISLPAVAEVGDALGRQPGEPLWPERYGLDDLRRIERSVGPRVWSALYQQNPAGEGAAEFDAEWLGDAVRCAAMPPVERLALRVIACDPSKGRSDRHGDYSAIVRVGLCDQGLLWVEADLRRRPVSRIVDDLLRHTAEFVPHAVAVETNQFQELIAGEVSRVASERGMAVPLVGLDNRVAKTVRIRTITPLLAAGRMRFRGGHDGTSLLLEQLRQFPTGVHDDGPDALEMAVRVLADMRFGVAREGIAGWVT